MSKYWSTTIILVSFALLLGYQNCGSRLPSMPAAETSTPTTLTVDGTIQKANLDGCNYVISAIDNSSGQAVNFVPLKMDPSLLKVGNVVSVTGSIRSDMVNTCMAGPILQVESANLVSGSPAPSTSP